MRKFVSLVLSVVLIASLAGCEIIGGGEGIFSGDRIVDWAPVYVCLKVTDDRGTDLLDPENPNNMIDGTTITFKGETYVASRDRECLYQETKAYLARIEGLFLMKDSDIFKNKYKGYILRFGQIDGALDMDEDLVVTLPDGTTGTIHYHCSHHNERKLSCNRSWKFNGTKADGNIFTFVVPN